mmetsp:Transcript_483/g.785  ORF Transcript_483/g.785 Transcript_483/m.785 type:complete len:306 (-) Transcript_483:121-1038(-)|eukprot:CAMPEP_0119009546 /NCGR_PEP_ID=MMETSP1176-20130426/4439_1 /TAXON_ID=265551 /ORGANISM="Synedropsis recta cf, Strain CCMP1620" /LENGTH=305 /DNA_ID=CAMNT_0006962083 /DNA_START=121 /DNA_END=1038 /DNA_ORIENTATION=-
MIQNEANEGEEGEKKTQFSRRMGKLNSVCEGWAMLPRLFRMWDEDGNGFLDEKELFAGLNHYCTAKNINIDKKQVQTILNEVDDDDDRLLDTREFAVFFARFADLVDCCISDLAFFMIEQLSQGMGDDEISISTKRGSFFLAGSMNTPVVPPAEPKSSWIGLLSAVGFASTLDSSAPSSTAMPSISSADTLDAQQLELQLDEKIQMIHQLECKLRQREQAIEHLEHALEAKDEMIAVLRESQESQPTTDENIAGDIAAGPLCRAPSFDKSKTFDAEENALSLEERQVKSEDIFATIRTSFANGSA